MFLCVFSSFSLRILFSVVVLASLAESVVAERTFFTVIIQTDGDGKIIYDDLSVLVDSDKVERQITGACEDYDKQENGTVWKAVLDTQHVKSGGSAIVLFECKIATITAGRGDYLKLVKSWTNQWQRNMLKKAKRHSMPYCHDEYHRTGEMPMGMHRCVFQQLIDTTPAPFLPERKAHRGGALIDAVKTDLTCAPHFYWKINASVSSEYVQHGHCSIKITLQRTELTCCCYTDANACNYGTDVDELLACPDTAFSFIYNVDTGMSKESANLNYNNSFMLPTHHMFQHNCTFKFDVLRINRSDDFIVNTVAVQGNNSICNGKKFNGCWRRRRECTNLISPIRTYCCQFIGASAVSRNIFPVYESWGRFLRREIKERLQHTKNCTFTFSNAGTWLGEMPYMPCVYFVDPQEGKYLNIGLNTNFLVDYNFVMKRTFTNSTNVWMTQIIGRPTCRNCSDTASNMPSWYRMTIIVVVCLTGEHDVLQCDHPNVRSIASVLEDSPPQFKCHQVNNTADQPKIWDPICIEKLYYLTMDDLRVTFGAPSRLFFLNTDWGNMTISTKGNLFCLKGEPSDDRPLEYDDYTAYCVCMPKPGDGDHEPCNTGDTIYKIHSLEAMPPYKLSAEESSQVCAYPHSTSNKPIQQCGTAEVRRSHVCLFIKNFNDMTESVSCVKEDELTHREKKWRVKNANWHLYLMCRGRIFEDVPKCFLQDTQFGYYEIDPVLVCCCPAGECNEYLEPFLEDIFDFKTLGEFAEKDDEDYDDDDDEDD